MGLKDKILGKVGRHSQHPDVQETASEKRAFQNDEETQEEIPSRAQQRQNIKNEIAEEKKRKLTRRLNWIIAGLVVAIICVYCFMVFVNF